MNLDVHLNSRDALCGAGDLEVHVAEEVLQALDVRQQYEVVIRVPGHQAAGDACHHLLDGHARRHQGHAGRAGGRHGGGAVGLEGLGHRADGIGELLLAGKHWNQRPLR